MNNILSLMQAHSIFLNDFHACRQAFLKEIDTLEYLSPQTHSFDAGHIEDKSLTTDAVWLGPQTANKVSVFISGTHGIEGYCGSAIQRFLLQQLHQQTLDLPHNTALLFIHALNPWGMYWGRRCDEDGIDLNRNFIDFPTTPNPHKDYSTLLSALELENSKARSTALMRLLKDWGQEKYDEVFSSGQYQHSWAPFFGGRQPSKGNEVIENLINRWQLNERELVVIDLHTGLGPFAHGELISDHPANSTADKYSRALFQHAIANTEIGESSSVPKHGLLDYRWHQLMQNHGCFLTLEFGTLGTTSLFDVLLAEHLYWRTHRPNNINETTYQQHRLAMLNHFNPRDELWQQAALFKSWQVLTRILDFFHAN